jgi:hypothetical protein
VPWEIIGSVLGCVAVGVGAVVAVVKICKCKNQSRSSSDSVFDSEEVIEEPHIAIIESLK